MTDQQDDSYNPVRDPRTGRPPLPIDAEKMRETKQAAEADDAEGSGAGKKAFETGEGSDAAPDWPELDQAPGRMQGPDDDDDADDDDQDDDIDDDPDEDADADLDDADYSGEEDDDDIEDEGEPGGQDPEDPFSPRTGP